MKLAVIMPVYNHGPYLSRSLCAILNQERQPDQIILINDGSTDNTLEEAKGLLGHVPNAQIISDGANRGVVCRCNQGMTMTDADYIHFASSNDRVMPGLYRKSLDLLAQYPEAALCCAIDQWEEPNGGFHWRVGQRMASKPCYLSPKELIQLGKEDRLQISSPSCIVKRQAMIESGWFYQDHAWHCDWFTYMVAAFRRGVCYIPEILSWFSLQHGSFSSNMFNPERQRPVFRAMMRDLELFPEVSEAVRESHQLALFGSTADLVRMGFWQYLTPGFVARRSKITTLRTLRRWLPKRVGQVCLDLFKQ